MSRPPRSATAGTFFVTAITLMRLPRFQVEKTAQLFLETLQHYRSEGFYKLYAFVVMPDHVHLILSTDDLPRAMKTIKGGFAHRWGEKRFWQPGYTDHLIQDRSDFDSHVMYIHHNPVRARLTQIAEAYLYSSACPKQSQQSEGPGL